MWPKLLDLSRDECKRILRRLELEAYASLISAFRAQGDLSKDKKKLLDEIAKVLSISTERHRAEVRRAVNDESLSTVADVLSGPNSTYEWSVEGRRLVPLMPRLVPQTAFTGLANTAANIAAAHNSTLPDPADTAKKEVPGTSGVSSGTMKSPRSASPPSGVVVLPSGATITVKGEREDEMEMETKGRRRKRTSSSSTPHPASGASSRTVEARPLLLPTSSNIRVSQGTASSHSMSPVKITLAKTPPPKSSMAPTATQKIIIVSSQSSGPSFMPNILRSSHPASTSTTLARILPGNVSSSASSPMARIPSILLPHTPTSSSGSASGSLLAGVGSPTSSSAGATAFLSSTLAGTKPRVKTVTKQATQTRVVTTQLPMSQIPGGQPPRTMSPGSKPTIQIKQEPGTGVKIITQTLPGSKILPKPVTAATSSGPQVVMVTTTSSMATRPVGAGTTTVYAQNNGNRAIVNPAIGTRVVTMPTSTPSAGKATPPPTNIITVTPKTVQTMPLTVTRTLPSGATPYTIAKAGPSSAGKPSVIVVQQAKTIKTQHGKPITVVTTYITQSTPRPTFVSTIAGQSLGKGMTLTKAQPQQIKTRVVIRPRTPDQGSLSLSQQQSILGGIVEGIVIQRPSSSSPRAPRDSPGTGDDTSSVSSAGSEDVVKVQRAGQSPGASQSAPSSRVTNQWVEMDAALDIGSSQSQGTVQMSTSQSQSVQGESFSSAASTIKALLEIQSGSKVSHTELSHARSLPAQDKPRQSTIDLSQMAVPISLQQQGPQTVAASLQGEMAPEFFATEVVQQDQTPAAEAVPRTAQPPSGRQGIRISTAQHLLAEAHRKMQQGQVLGREEASLLEESYEGFTLDPQTGLFYKDEESIGGIESKMLHDIKVQTTTASGEPRTYTLTEWFTGLSGDRPTANQQGQPSSSDATPPSEPKVVAVPTEKILESALSASFTSTELEYLRSGGRGLDSSAETGSFASVRMPSSIEPLATQSLSGLQEVSSTQDSAQSQSILPLESSTPVQEPGKGIAESPGTESTLETNAGSERKMESRDRGNIFENIVASVQADSNTLQQRSAVSVSKPEFTTLRDYVQSTMGKKVSVEPVLPTQQAPMDAPDHFSQDNLQDLLELLGQATSTLASFDQPSSSKTTVMVEPSGFDPSSLKMEDFTSQRVEAESFTKDDPEDRDKGSPDSTILTPTSVSPSQERMVSPARMHHPSGSSSGNESLDTPMRASKRKRKAPPPLDEDPPPASLPSWARAALGLLHRVSKFRGSGRLKGEMGAAEWFIHPVDPAVAPDYYNIIKQPMDFSTIKKKLEGGQYSSLEEFHADMQLIKSNCFQYNPPGHEARRDCEEVFNFYLHEYGKLMDKCKTVVVVPKSPKKFKLDVSKSPSKSL
ncbi:PREDICTED: BRCA2-interacting transcriptional repressor EMSY-like isoform X2 [Branchiostoma belcheri]|uniref:BRCA2-interacting transcriptional repressor EMSY-like isoform X2 n=1 Tax=Branchiostoma belcheri TaxID=7741 RepID=A0A6P4ZDT8_BRABE|nr:PREDICTED: BRCA2-interacting transcriptional repressor EMSY-like isoform X2 [Branchiostoma belcheri]